MIDKAFTQKKKKIYAYCAKTEDMDSFWQIKTHAHNHSNLLIHKNIKSKR